MIKTQIIKYRKKYCLFIPLILLLFSNFLIAQNTDRTVFLNASVSDIKGRFPDKVDAQDVQLFINGKFQKITSFEIEDVPMSIGVLFDTSKSMLSFRDNKKPRINFARYGLIEFLNQSDTENEYFLISISEKPELLLNFTQDAKKVFETVKMLDKLKLSETTVFYETLVFGIEKLKEGKFSKKILLVISDGQDSSSKIKLKDIKKTLNRSNVSVYPVSIGDISSPLDIDSSQINVQIDLEKIASMSGGKAYFPGTQNETEKFFRDLAQLLRRQYKIGFEINEKSFSESELKDKPLRVELKVKQNEIIEDGKRKKVKMYPVIREEIFLQNKF